MIIKVPFDKDEHTGDNIVYLDDDARNFLENMNYHEEVDYIGADYYIDGNRGIIIGCEDNLYLGYYYFLIFLPDIGMIAYVPITEIIK